MRPKPAFVFALLLVATSVPAQVNRQTQPSNTTEDLRGVSAVSQQVAWASGTHGTFLRTTDGGRTWISGQVPGASTLDFRGVVAFSADEAFLMSSGPGDQSRIYHTSDAGQHWRLEFSNTNPKGFFDSIAFWDRTHGIVLGDPIPDESGQLKFQLLITADGQSWTSVPTAQLPPALEGEGAFAASNSCLSILVASPNLAVPWKSGVSVPHKPEEKEAASAPGSPDPNIWFATGGKAARVFHSPDRGSTWQVFDTPIIHGPDSAGIFSIAFRDPLHGVIAGGDYKHPEQDGPNLAFTNDGGKRWTLSKIFPQSYYSAVAYDRRSLGTSTASMDVNQAHVRLFIVSGKSVYDFRPPSNPTRISPPKKSGLQFNAVSPYPTGGVLLVGPHGSIATIP
ncbi:MAG: YCF48-related protein [Candidatus Sulfotelmatobacter sp.]